MGSVPFSTRAWTLAILMAMAAAGRAQVQVTPRRAVLRAGQSLTFKAQWAEPGKDPQSWRWKLADGMDAALDEATGHCTAPAVDQVRTLRILAIHPENPTIQGESGSGAWWSPTRRTTCCGWWMARAG
jgi:hypothetical protein